MANLLYDHVSICSYMTLPVRCPARREVGGIVSVGYEPSQRLIVLPILRIEQYLGCGNVHLLGRPRYSPVLGRVTIVKVKRIALRVLAARLTAFMDVPSWTAVRARNRYWITILIADSLKGTRGGQVFILQLLRQDFQSLGRTSRGQNNC